jgi:hypothetical protein
MRGAFARFARCRRFQPPASSPQPSESDRETLRLKIRLARRKQTIPRRSNRVGKRRMFFSGGRAPTTATPRVKSGAKSEIDAPKSVSVRNGRDRLFSST